MANSRYQYGTSPRKLEPNYTRRPVKKKELKVVKELPRQQIKISKEQKQKQLKTTLTLIAIFLLFLTISCRNSQIDRQFNYIQDQKKQLAAIEKENEQLRVNIENSINLINIEKAAKEQLGMQRLSNKQTIYVTLPKKDYVESASEKVVIEQEKSWFQKIIDKVFDF